jgi:hypothetical protein
MYEWRNVLEMPYAWVTFAERCMLDLERRFAEQKSHAITVPASDLTNGIDELMN